MKHLSRVLACAIAFHLALAPAAALAQAKIIPDLAAQDAQGTDVKLRGYIGHVVLVDFWASWCPPCKASFPALDALSKELNSRGVVVLAINVDERRRDADAFLSEHPHTMTVLFDPKGTLPSALKMQGMPSSFVVDRLGTIRFTHMGYTGNIEDQERHEITQLLSEGAPR
jgi:thiol-disulfide isomerase/thioredoxin